MFILFYDNCIAAVFRFIKESQHWLTLYILQNKFYTLQFIILNTECRQSGKDELHTNVQCENNQNILCKRKCFKLNTF